MAQETIEIPANNVTAPVPQTAGHPLLDDQVESQHEQQQTALNGFSSIDDQPLTSRSPTAKEGKIIKEIL